MATRNPFQFQMPADMGDNVKAQAQEIWLAGLGAFSKAQQEGGKMFQTLVDDGVNMQRNAQKAAEAKIAEATEKMTKAVDVAKEDFATVRTGRANPQLFQKILVEYYRTPTPLAQLASLQNPEARTIIITPYDKSALKEIEKAIVNFPNLGANPSNDGEIIRVTMPELTEDRRKEYVKSVKQKAEDC